MGRSRDSKNETKSVAVYRETLIKRVENLGLPPEFVAAIRSLPPKTVEKTMGQFRDFLVTYGRVLDTLFGKKPLSGPCD